MDNQATAPAFRPRVRRALSCTSLRGQNAAGGHPPPEESSVSSVPAQHLSAGAANRLERLQRRKHGSSGAAAIALKRCSTSSMPQQRSTGFDRKALVLGKRKSQPLQPQPPHPQQPPHQQQQQQHQPRSQPTPPPAHVPTNGAPAFPANGHSESNGVGIGPAAAVANGGGGGATAPKSRRPRMPAVRAMSIGSHKGASPAPSPVLPEFSTFPMVPSGPNGMQINAPAPSRPDSGAGAENASHAQWDHEVGSQQFPSQQFQAQQQYHPQQQLQPQQYQQFQAHHQGQPEHQHQQFHHQQHQQPEHQHQQYQQPEHQHQQYQQQQYQQQQYQHQHQQYQPDQFQPQQQNFQPQQQQPQKQQPQKQTARGAQGRPRPGVQRSRSGFGSATAGAHAGLRRQSLPREVAVGRVSAGWGRRNGTPSQQSPLPRSSPSPQPQQEQWANQPPQRHHHHHQGPPQIGVEVGVPQGQPLAHAVPSDLPGMTGVPQRGEGGGQASAGQAEGANGHVLAHSPSPSPRGAPAKSRSRVDTRLSQRTIASRSSRNGGAPRSLSLPRLQTPPQPQPPPHQPRQQPQAAQPRSVQSSPRGAVQRADSPQSQQGTSRGRVRRLSVDERMRHESLERGRGRNPQPPVRVIARRSASASPSPRNNSKAPSPVVPRASGGGRGLRCKSESRALEGVAKSLRSDFQSSQKLEQRRVGGMKHPRTHGAAELESASAKASPRTQQSRGANQKSQPSMKAPPRSHPLSGTKKMGQNVPRVVREVVAVWEQGGSSEFETELASTLARKMEAVIERHQEHCVRCKVSVRQLEDDANSPGHAPLSAKVAALCDKAVRKLHEVCAPIVEQCMLDLLEAMPDLLEGTRPSRDESDALHAFIKSCDEPCVTTLRQCIDEHSRLLDLRDAMAPLLPEVEAHERLLVGIDQFERQLAISPVLKFKHQGTTQITVERFRVHSGIYVVRTTRQLRDHIQQWEARRGEAFCVEGARYLERLPTDAEVAAAEQQVQELLRSNPLYYQPIESDGAQEPPPMQGGALRVCVRVRPLVLREEGTKPALAIADGGNRIEFRNKDGAGSLPFPHCIPPSATQEDVYTLCGLPTLVRQVVREGQYATVMAYGQTGSGKTHTLSGPSEALCVQRGDELLDAVPDAIHAVIEDIRREHLARQGVIPRAARAIFDEVHTLARHRPNTRFEVHLSCLEVHNEAVHDLLRPSSGSLQIRGVGNGFVADGLSEVLCDNPTQLLTAFVHACANRKTSPHSLNEESSRSHALTTISVTCVDTQTQGRLRGELCLVDMAGSEKLAQSHTSGKAGIAESSMINKSLLMFSRVVSVLAAGDRGAHVPYRDSALTRLLMHSLRRGDGMNVLIACVSPSAANAEESLSTLTFARKACALESGMHGEERPKAQKPARAPVHSLSLSLAGKGAAERASKAVPEEGEQNYRELKREHDAAHEEIARLRRLLAQK